MSTDVTRFLDGLLTKSAAPDECGANAPGGGGFQPGNKCGMRGTVRTGKRLTLDDGSELPAHIPRLPPAWTDVLVNTDPKAALVAIGTDQKGRKQYVYSTAHHAKQAAKKFAKIQSMLKQHDDIRREIVGDLNKTKSEEAAALLLIHETGIRPGSTRDTKADKQAYGAVTLEKRHVTVSGKKATLNFTGKKGVSIQLEIQSPDVVAMLKRRTAGKADGDRLFPELDDQELREYTKTTDGGKFNPKDFRTARGTLTAASIVDSLPVPTTEKEYRKQVLHVGGEVAKILGNTRTVALQSYIDPHVFVKWQKFRKTK